MIRTSNRGITGSVVLLLLALPSALCFKIAFVGDTGVQTEGKDGYYAEALFNMLVDNGVDLVVQNGDLDYEENPQKWDDFIAEHVLDAGMDILVASGNHEEEEKYGSPWYGPDGYKALMSKRLESSDLLANKCFGEYGERFYCEFDDVLILMLGWKQTFVEEVEESAKFLENVFAQTDKKMKFCTWHQPEGKLNPGEDHIENFQTQKLYEICRQNAAIINTGHSHIYSRSRLISSFLPDGSSPQDNPDPRVSDDDQGNPIIDCGLTISIISGMGGQNMDDNGPYALKPYFKTTFTDNNGDKRAGALICDVPRSTNEHEDVEIECEFMLSTEAVLEDFSLTIKSSTYGHQCFNKQIPSNTPRFCDWFFC